MERTSGEALTKTMRRQAKHFGAEFLLAEVTALTWAAILDRPDQPGDLNCFGVLLAAGAHPRKVGFKGGRTVARGGGVAYCATCDGEFFTGKDVS